MLRKSEETSIRKIRNYYTGEFEQSISPTTNPSLLSRTGAIINRTASVASSALDKAVNLVKGTWAELFPKLKDQAKKAFSELSASWLIKRGLGALIGGDVFAGYPVIKAGSKGQAVKDLQLALNKLSFGPLVVDGDFGAKTTASVVNYQKNKKLTADGIVGPKTWAQLEIDTTKSPVSSAVKTVPAAVVTTTQSSNPSSTTKQASSPASRPSDAYAMLGDKGITVTQLQANLNKMGFSTQTGNPPLVTDGAYGPNTQKAVSWAQATLRHPSQNYVTQALWQAILRVVPGITSTMSTSSSSSGASQSVPSDPVSTSVAYETTKTVNPTNGSISEDTVKGLLALDPNKRAMTSSRLMAATSKRPEDSYFLDAVVANVVEGLKAAPFSFFDQLNNVPQALVRALAWHETSVNNSLVGQAGELTMFQLLPKTIAALREKYTLPAFSLSDPLVISKYLLAIFRDQDKASKSFVNKGILGEMTSAKPGNEEMQSVLSQLPGSPAILSQLVTFFMIYNAGYSNKYWLEDQRQYEAMLRAVSVALSAGGW